MHFNMVNLIVVTLILAAVCCGFSKSEEDERIVGGIEASLNQFPYMVNIYYNKGFHCGGSILSAKTILTAAHCTYGGAVDDFEINAGSLIVGEGITRQMSQIIVREDYDPMHITNDIALLILKTALPFSAAVQPIQFERAYIGGDENSTATGWGMTSYPGVGSRILLYLNLRTVEQEECERLMKPKKIRPSHLCAFSGNEGEGICKGDSGGPLTVNGKIVGVSSWVKKLCAKGAPDVFARVSLYANWIDENIV